MYIKFETTLPYMYKQPLVLHCTTALRVVLYFLLIHSSALIISESFVLCFSSDKCCIELSSLDLLHPTLLVPSVVPATSPMLASACPVVSI